MVFAIFIRMRPTPIELRQRIVRARMADKQTMGEIAQRFEVPKGTVQNILEHFRDTGGIEPKPQNAGRKSVFDDEALRALENDVYQHPDGTLADFRQRSNVDASLVTFHNALKKLGFTLKKKRYKQASKIDQT